MRTRLEDLLKDTKYRLICGGLDTETGDIIWDSREVKEGDVFVAVIGRVDGTKYVPSSIDSGASVIVIDEHQSLYTDDGLKALAAPKGIAVVELPDSRRGLGILAANKFNHPERSLELYGVTGTKGKTTSAFMLHMILQRAGRMPGLMGTAGTIMGDKRVHTEYTTSEAPLTYKFMGELRDNGYDSFVMEASSLGLKLERDYGLHYKAGCFTNFFRDHVGGIEHPDEEDYFRSKLIIFDHSDYGVVNLDCSRADEVCEYASARCHVVTYSITDERADLRATDMVRCIKDGVSGTTFTLVIGDDRYTVFVPIPGVFNVYNALCALSCAHIAGIDMNVAAEAVGFVRVPGRLEPVHNDKGINVLVDYAHNGESLASAIGTVREFTKGKVITVFGAGGERPAERRWDMGRISGEMSDYSIITTDNPRAEDPIKIIDEILEGIDQTDGLYESIPDRRTAILRGLSLAVEGDTVLIAGRGHEDYQDLDGKIVYLDDREVAKEFFANE